MISYDEIRQLQDYPAGPDTRILSIYVNVDQSDAANLNRGFETRVDALCRKAAENQDSDEANKERFRSECKRVKAFLRDYVPKGKSLVVFSDSKQDFWWQRDLQVELPSGARWSQQPWVRPLLEVIEDNDRIAVVLIDKQRARVLAADAAGIQELAEIVSDVPNKHVTTGTDHIWSQTQMERDHTKHVQWHAKRVADELTSLVERTRLSRIVVGGPVEATSVFAAELPKRLQQMIAGAISGPVDAGRDRLLAELDLVREKAENDRAVLGVSDTLSAIQEGRIYRLVVARDFRTEGKECSSCNVLLADGNDDCPFCQGKLEPAPDLINRASRRVLDMGGKVNLVSGEAASRMADAGIGAVLRF
jgi:hypothetical protein